MAAAEVGYPIALVVTMESDYWLIHVGLEERSSHGFKRGRRQKGEFQKRHQLGRKLYNKPKKGTHKNEGSLRPEIILGRIDLQNNQSVYPQGVISGSSLWVLQKAMYELS